MALASQSTRPDRPFQSSRSNRTLLGARGLIALGAAGAAFGGSYWLMRGDAIDVVEPATARSAGALLASSESALLASSESATLAPIPAALTVQPIAPSPEAQRAVAQNAPAPTTPPTATPATPPTTTPTTPPTQPTATPEPSAPIGNGFDGKQLESKPQPTTTQQGAIGGVAEGLALAATDPVKARRALSEALLSGTLPPMESKQASDALAKIAAQLVFTPVYNASDPYFFQYTVQAGDSLEKIVRKHKIGCDWRLVARINNIKRPEAIRVGQRLKLPKGPFSAVVTKRDYRVDLCMGAGSDRVVMTSLPCGLGSANGTPTGRFRVRPSSKLLNPEWTHPVTGQHYKADDALNPIGEHWLGLEGIEASNSSLAGYGMHGTVEPESIGRDMSLGCVRLIADDVAIVWETLGDGCEVEIRP
jgi:lipoprotein-anchoring transpeptidase ErfK/SrfK